MQSPHPSLLIIARNFAAGAGNDRSNNGGCRGVSEELDVAIDEDHVCTTGVEREDFIVWPAVVGQLPVAGGRTIGRGTLVVVIDDLEAVRIRGVGILRRVTRNAESVILLSPAPESASGETGVVDCNTRGDSRIHVRGLVM